MRSNVIAMEPRQLTIFNVLEPAGTVRGNRRPRSDRHLIQPRGGIVPSAHTRGARLVHHRLPAANFRPEEHYGGKPADVGKPNNSRAELRRSITELSKASLDRVPIPPKPTIHGPGVGGSEKPQRQLGSRPSGSCAETSAAKPARGSAPGVKTVRRSGERLGRPGRLSAGRHFVFRKWRPRRFRKILKKRFETENWHKEEIPLILLRFSTWIAALPGDPAFLPPSSLRSMLPRNLAPASGRQDHTTRRPRQARQSSAPSASTASRSASVTLRNAPLRSGTKSLWC